MNTFIIFALGALILVLSSTLAVGLAWLDSLMIGSDQGYFGTGCLVLSSSLPAFVGAISGMAAGAHSRPKWVPWTSAAAGSLPGLFLVSLILLSPHVPDGAPLWRSITSLFDIVIILAFFVKPAFLAGALSGVLVHKLLEWKYR